MLYNSLNSETKDKETAGENNREGLSKNEDYENKN